MTQHPQEQEQRARALELIRATEVATGTQASGVPELADMLCAFANSERLAPSGDVMKLLESMALPFSENCNWEAQAMACQSAAEAILEYLSTTSGGVVLMPRRATREMVDAADACVDAYSAYLAMVEAGHVR